MQRHQQEMQDRIHANSNPGGQPMRAKSSSHRQHVASISGNESIHRGHDGKRKKPSQGHEILHDSMDIRASLPPSIRGGSSAKHQVLASSSSNHPPEFGPGHDSSELGAPGLHLFNTNSLPHEMPDLPRHPTDTNSNNSPNMM